MADTEDADVPFSPILIMEFIRQSTVARCLNNETTQLVVRFKLPKVYYDEIMGYYLHAQLIRLYLDYDETSEILSVKTDDVLINRFKEQKSLVEIAGKYENKFAERYKKFIEVLGEEKIA